jgi:hypothetical protein
MKKIIVPFLFTICILASPVLFAQSQFSGWLASFNTIKLGAKTSIHADIQLRSSDKIKHVQTLLLRTGLNVQLKKNITVTAGYAYISNRRIVSDVSGYAPEHRIWEQLLITHKIKFIPVSHRFRIEQRFLSTSTAVNNELENDLSGYANRFRYFFRGIIPFQKQQNFQKGMFAALQNEVFINFGNTDDVNGKFFDQNRLYAAIGYRINSTSDIEAGYLNQYTSLKNGSNTNNVIQLAYYLKL